MKTFDEWLAFQKVGVRTDSERGQLKQIYDEMVLNNAANEEESFQDWLARFGTDYYIAARQAAMIGLVPLYGNLFHHAIEMYLKSALVGVLTIQEMKSRRYGHDLEELWKRFKQSANDDSLARFDSTVKALHRFESIRYPDLVVKEGMMATVAWTREQLPKGATGPGVIEVPLYTAVIQDIDELVLEVLRRVSCGYPKFITARLLRKEAKMALAYQNAYADKWGLTADPPVGPGD